MIYTCYEMARDCRADKPQGWSYFIAQYVPVIRKLLEHYAPSTNLEGVLTALQKPESGLFQSLDPMPERWFVGELRQTVLAGLPADDPGIGVDLDAVAAALEPLTVVEKQVAWLDTMRYNPAQTGAMLRMSAQTVEKIRSRAAEFIRGRVDAWRPSILSDNGMFLGRAAAAAGGKECLPVREFLDVLDGRTTWRGREVMERHVTACWHCIDHFCRMVEVVDLLRGLQPLPAAEAEPYRKLFALPAEKGFTWKRVFGRA